MTVDGSSAQCPWETSAKTVRHRQRRRRSKITISSSAVSAEESPRHGTVDPRSRDGQQPGLSLCF